MPNLVYKNLDSLHPVKLLLDEASEALKDKSRTIVTSTMSEVLAAAAGAGAGVAVGTGVIAAGAAAGTGGAAAITSGLAAAGALVGGGMMAGIFVASAPVALLGIGAYAVVSNRNKSKLVQAKELLIQAAVAKRDAIIREQEDTAQDQEQRAEYLAAINIKLQQAIKNLKLDLDPAS